MIEKNKTREVVNRLDKLYFSGANAIVKSWNWVTGDTKAELANRMLIAAPILDFYAVARHGGANLFLGGAICVGFMTMISAGKNKVNFEMQRKEIEAIEKKAKSSTVEIEKRVVGYGYPLLWGSVPVKLFAENPERMQEQEVLDFGGFYLRGLAGYVMGADYVPPKKNLVSRGIDKLGELIVSREGRACSLAEIG
jgi:hypothetical protein